MWGWIHTTGAFTPKGEAASKRASNRAVVFSGLIILVCLISLLFPGVFDPIMRLETRYDAAEDLIIHTVMTICVTGMILSDYRRIKWRSSDPCVPEQPQE